jgi:hypothetical protein
MIRVVANSVLLVTKKEMVEKQQNDSSLNA